jgi:hypothetical protein
VRSAEEIRFRLRQELANARLFVAPPSLARKTGAAARLAVLADPQTIVAHLRGGRLAREIEALAESICGHRFPILGYELETGGEIRWRRDYIHGVESDLRYFRRIPYLNPALAGDHKIIWELNRHQHLVVLAQASILTGRAEFLDEIPRQLESWWRQNPYVRGINWTSALEVAFRALSWVWICHLVGPDLPRACADRLREELYRHGVYLEYNLSVYFSPNTHLLGEAVVLHALGAFFPEWPRSKAWRSLGGRIAAEEMGHQVREDGSHFEQSSAYHIYATDFFLFHALLETVSDAYVARLRRMADYLAALTSADGMIPLMGDDDGGRLFHPYGKRRRFGAATLATCCVFFGREEWPYEPADLDEQAAWWCGEKAYAERPGEPEAQIGGRLFADAGVAVLASASAKIIVDTRGFGHAGAGHSHAHALEIVCRSGGRDVLIDPGTYTYVGEPEWRARFRGTGFHNTVRIDGLDQATGMGPFRWRDKPATEILRWEENEDWCLLDAVCVYRALRHRRTMLWLRDREVLAVVDEIGGEGEHRIEQFWHCGEVVAPLSPGVWRINDSATLSVPLGSSVRELSGGEYGWQSSAPGLKAPSPVIVVEQTARLPVTLAAVLAFGTDRPSGPEMALSGDGIRLILDARRSITLSPGFPVIETA